MPALFTELRRRNVAEDQEANTWLAGAEPKVRCYRPEHLLVEKQQESPLRVVESRYGNSLGELELQDERSDTTRVVFHRPNGKRFQAGDRVVLRVLAMFMAMFLVLGCRRDRGRR